MDTVVRWTIYSVTMNGFGPTQFKPLVATMHKPGWVVKLNIWGLLYELTLSRERNVPRFIKTPMSSRGAEEPSERTARESGSWSGLGHSEIEFELASLA